MKLYSTVCWGLLVVFLCNTPKPAIVSELCLQTAQEIKGLSGFSPEELKPMTREHKKYIVSLKRKYQRLCN